MDVRSILTCVLLPCLLAACADKPAVMPPAVALVENARQSGKPVVVEFGAATCASCRVMKGVMDKVAQRTQGRAHVLVLDIIKQEGLIAQYRIQLMPTQVFFDASGREIQRHMGVLSEAQVLAGLGLAEDS